MGVGSGTAGARRPSAPADGTLECGGVGVAVGVGVGVTKLMATGSTERLARASLCHVTTCGSSSLLGGGRTYMELSHAMH